MDKSQFAKWALRFLLIAASSAFLAFIAYSFERAALLRRADARAAIASRRAIDQFQFLLEFEPAPIAALSDSRLRGCDPSSLQAMRSVLFADDLVHDIAVLRGGEVACTATLGVLRNDIRLGRDLITDGSERSLALADWSPYGYKVAFFVRFADLALVIDPASFESRTDDGVAIRFRYGDEPLSLAVDALEEPQDAVDPLVEPGAACVAGSALCVVSEVDESRVLADGGPRLLTVATFTFVLAMASAGAAVLVGFRLRDREGHVARARRCFETRDYRFHFQPILDMRSGVVCGAEALFRPWGSSADLGVPYLIDFAEREGRSADIAVRAVEAAARDIFPRIARDDFHVSVNVQPTDLSRDLLLSKLSDMMRRSGLPLQAVHVEVTERAAIPADELSRLIETWRRAGFRVAIDDFGTGYQNLARLAQIHVDEIKIDGVFTNSVGKGSVQELMLDRLLQLVSSPERSLVVEGVETEEQHLFFSDKTRAFGQGWYYSKALPAAEFLEWDAYRIARRGERGPAHQR